MEARQAVEALKEAVRVSGLIDPDSEGVVMISGGPDSVCALAGITALVGPENVHALHVNYGLRDTSARDERICRDVCARLRIDLHVERARREDLGSGNLQAAARELRYDAAERLRARTASKWIATGHTRSDLAETVLYRLAVSPGSRALLGLAPRAGRVVRPLLGLTRAEVRRLAEDAGLPFADDPTNLDLRFARNRIRAEVLPALREISEHAERNIAETRAELAEEQALLERVALEALEAAGAAAGATEVPAAAVVAWDPATRRLALRALAERAAGRLVPLGRARAAEIARLAAHPEGGEIQLPGGVSAICEAGMVRFVTEHELDAAPEPVALTVPGRCRLAEWEVRAELHPAPVRPAGPGLATLDAAALGAHLEVRTWRAGDRMRPLGMSGTKSLQDLFTDRGIPRSERHRIPVVVSGGRIAWVAGVAVGEEFRIREDTRTAVVLTVSRG
ncbi:MAG TPA: tRNA lysidine(34) synthetase TilS [Solirubrobacterales bacterium]